MNKQELVKKIAFDAEVTQRQASVMIDSLINTVMQAVAQGDKVQLVGFGTFESRQRAAKTGHHPITGETLEIPATTVPVFKPGVEFKEMVAD